MMLVSMVWPTDCNAVHCDQTIPAKAKGSQHMNRKCFTRTRIYKFQPPTLTLRPQISYFLSHRNRCQIIKIRTKN